MADESLAVDIAILSNEVKHLTTSIEEIKDLVNGLRGKVDEQDELIQRGKGVLMILGLFGTTVMAAPTLIAGYFKATGK